MFSPANEAHFTLDLPGLEHDFRVLSFRAHEAISQCYRIELQLVSDQPDLDLEALLQRNAWLGIQHGEGEGTGLHGLIHHAAIGEAGKRLTRYCLELVPHLHYLGLRHNQRIFQHLTVPQIISRVLADHGIQSDAYSFQLGVDYPERDYCTQYDETDLHFIQRLCEEEGIHYHFRHSPDGHHLVFGDDQTVFPRLAPTGFDQGNGMVADEPVIKRFGVRLETRTSRVTRRDYDHQKARLLLESQARGEQLPDLEDYDYPGRFTDRSRGKHLAQRSLERHRSDYRQATGHSDQPTLRSGHFLELQGHPRDSWNDLWLITDIHHEGKQPQVLEESITSAESAGTDYSPSPARGEGETAFTQGYRNHFQATPWDTPHRPALRHPKPRVLGQQLGRQPLGQRDHPAHRHGSTGQFSGRRPGPATGLRLSVQQCPSGALRAAGTQDPQPVQEPEQPRRQRLQRTAHRGQGRRGADLHPRPARLGSEHPARPAHPRRQRAPRAHRSQPPHREPGRRAPPHPRRSQDRDQGRRPPDRRGQPAH